MKNKDINQFCLKESSTVRECMEVIEKNKEGIALVVDPQGRLIGTVTDGDIRRFILAARSLEEPVSNVMWTNPLTAPLGTSEEEVKELMNKYMVRNIPIIDKKGRPCNLMTITDLVSEKSDCETAVIMAGGEGRRLRPITEKIPKPMLNIGDKSIIENIINAFVEIGIEKTYISVNYKAKVIEDYLKKYASQGIKIEYLEEHKKLGTAGALTLLPEIPSRPFIVINADIVTKTNFARLIEFHNQHRCVMTVAATQFEFNIPYGVLNLSEHYLLGIQEKPGQKLLCNAGIYMINPEVLPVIPKDTEFNMTDLINELVRKGLPLTTFPIHEYWIDIGKMEDLEKVQDDIKDS